MSSFGGPRLILTVPGGSSRPNKTSSVKKLKFSKLSLMPFCQITAEFLDTSSRFCLFGLVYKTNMRWMIGNSLLKLRRSKSKPGS